MAEPKRSGLYIIRHTSGAFYVGRSVNLAARFANHRWALRNRHVRNRRLRALLSRADVSADQFSFAVLLICTPTDLSLYEDRALAAYIGDPNCLNVCGVGGAHDEATRLKISRANRGRTSPQKGRVVTEATRRRQSESAKIRFEREREPMVARLRAMAKKRRKA